jgi:nucleoside triphosphate diphosphatase
VRPMDRLLEIMAQLRHQQEGCPWDREQTFATIAPYTVEEAYEVADAIERNDMVDLKSELGDLLFQVVFHARMAEEQNKFEFDDVAQAIIDKMINRHPHVFGDAQIENAAAQTEAWENHKARERAAQKAGILDGIAGTLPPISRAVKLQNRAARVGFDWPDAAQIFDKLTEEVAEIKAELKNMIPERLEDEMGDILFVCVNLARKLGVDPDRALKRTNTKFERRFGYIEQRLSEMGRTPGQSTLDEMDRLWNESKRLER